MDNTGVDRPVSGGDLSSERDPAGGACHTVAEASYWDAFVRMELPCGGGNISSAWWCRDGVAGCWRGSLAELMLIGGRIRVVAGISHRAVSMSGIRHMAAIVSR